MKNLLQTHPAVSYDLNVLTCLLGKCSIRLQSPESQAAVVDLLEQFADNYHTDAKPVVPHTSDVLLTEAQRFYQKLLHQLNGSNCQAILPGNLIVCLRSLIEDVIHQTAKLATAKQTQLLCKPVSIEAGYGIDSLLKFDSTFLEAELGRWDSQKTLPTIPQPLSQPVDTFTTKNLINTMASDVFELPVPHVDSYQTSNDQAYHLFWSVNEVGISYVTPSSYDVATQFSFDLPHNVSHLAHLAASKPTTALYLDSMNIRSYYESVAVLSEYLCIQLIDAKPDVFQRSYNLLPNTGAMSFVEFTEWLKQRRVFEFRLRAVRMIADQLWYEGMNYPKIIDYIVQTVQISKPIVEKEVRKYIPWTGLGAVYSLGYNCLLKSGVTSVALAIRPCPRQVCTSWQSFARLTQGVSAQA